MEKIEELGLELIENEVMVDEISAELKVINDRWHLLQHQVYNRNNFCFITHTCTQRLQLLHDSNCMHSVHLLLFSMFSRVSGNDAGKATSVYVGKGYFRSSVFGK